MAKGASIVVDAEPNGMFLEGIVSGTPKPGVCMAIVAATAPVGGRFTWQVSQRSTGAIGIVAVLREDDLQGKVGVSKTAAFTGGPPAPGDAYVTGTRCFMYCPIAGEQVNMQYHDVAGTGDSIAIGDLFGVETLTGQMIKNSSFASAPFQALETVTQPTADLMMWMLYLGNAA